MGINLPADVWLAPGNAGAAAAIAAIAALTVASVRRRTFRRRSRVVCVASTFVAASENVLPAVVSTESPLLEGMYRKRAVQMAFGTEGALFITLALSSRAARVLEIGAGVLPESAPFSPLNRARLDRLPAPWSLAIRGRQLWLSVPGDAHDPLLLRRRLEFACDLADEWDTANAGG